MKHRRLAAVGVAVLSCIAVGAGEARAQATVREARLDGLTILPELNVASCADETAHSLRLDVTGLTRQSYTMRFIRYPDSAPNAPCPVDMLDPEIVEVEPGEEVDTPNGRLDATYSLTYATIIGPDCEDGGRGNFHFCFQLTALPDDVTAVVAGGVEVLFDTTLPPKPTIEGINTGDTSVTVDVAEVDTDGEAFTTIVQYRTCGADTVADAGTAAEEESECNATGTFSEADSDTFTVVVGSLKANTEIELRALFEDDFGNRGPATGLRVIAPEATLSPLSLYDGTDNPVSCEASCADTGSTSGAALFLVALSGRARRTLRRVLHSAKRTAARGRGLQVLAALLTLGFGAPALADFGQTTIGLGLSPYKPAIDTEKAEGSLQRIFPLYECFFDDATLIEIGGDIDTHLFDGFGSLQFAFGMSMAQAQGFAQPTSARATNQCQKPTDTEVQLTLAKVRPGLVYRFDPFLDWIGFPLVPYGRVGAVIAGYAWTKDGDFDQGGQNPVGLRFGWEGALGLMLALDFLDSIDPFVPDTTRRARANGVFDHTFLFVEGAYQDITTFGQPGLVLTPVDEFIGTGWPVLWKIGVAVELL